MNLYVTIIVVVVVVFVFPLIFGVLVIIVGPRHRKRLVKDRSNFSDSEIHRMYFPELPYDTTIQVWNEIAKTLSIEPGKMRPNDQFDQLRGPTIGLETEIDDLLLLVPCWTKEENEMTIDTVGELVQLIVNKKQTRDDK